MRDLGEGLAARLAERLGAITKENARFEEHSCGNMEQRLDLSLDEPEERREQRGHTFGMRGEHHVLTSGIHARPATAGNRARLPQRAVGTLGVFTLHPYTAV